ncbi:MAG: DUF3168 domain-containing protein [Bacteroidetes bacterium]|nr:MAG: DUF3168 domain-containing protein [Bacteroidota bacterium]
MIGALVTYLLQVDGSGVSQNLTDSAGNKLPVYHLRVPQGADFPAVVYDVISGTPDYCKKGARGTQEWRVQFDIYHESDFEAATIADNLRDILEGWQGTHNGVKYNYTTVASQVEGWGDLLAQALVTVDVIFRTAN